ncbi:SPOR domain-containing protein [Tepidicella baoligensis]|uniref:SPOR domain-containing protein n=1 Tax=Tepidicella baoligensis TaxID=2707016 RepID=UPI0015DBAECE|nr:SPOR domain-containing protein [Tepidicella baoligensis]
MKTRKTPPQRGGTILGFIAGLLVGLAVALVVAVYVTKVPVPLVDRGVQRPPSADAVEAERNRQWNPNAALSSRPSAPAAAPAPAPTPTPALPGTPLPPASDQDPIGQLIEQRTAGSPGGVASVEAPPLVDPFIYYVQVGAFRNGDEAEAQRARLAMLGFEAGVSEREQAGRPVFRVRLGPFQRKIDAEVMEQRVQGQGFETALVRVQR